MRIDLVREILEVGHMTPLPLMPAFVRGVTNLRGRRRAGDRPRRPAPACPPPSSAGAPASSSSMSARRRRRTQQTLGVLVDAVQEVINIAERDLEPVLRLGTRTLAHLRSMVRHRQRRPRPSSTWPRSSIRQRLVGLIGGYRQHAQPPH